MRIVRRMFALTAALAVGVCSAQKPAVVDATLADVKGAVLVNQGELFAEAPEGTRLKASDRIMAMEDASARVRFFEGCDLQVDPGNVVVVPDQLPCDCLNFEDEKGPVAVLSEMAGDVSLKTGNVFDPIGLGRELKVGEVVRTAPDSTAVIQFRDGCKSDVAASSEYEIPDASPCACALIASAPNPALGFSNQTLARLIIPPIIIIGISLPDNDGPISP